LRITIDVLLIAVGVFFGWGLVEIVSDYRRDSVLVNSGWSWFLLTYAALLIWVLGPIFIFGSDLIQWLRRKRPLTAARPKGEALP
jgi:TRAP-type C4-dicarboxylate transport system permease small subunit